MKPAILIHFYDYFFKFMALDNFFINFMFIIILFSSY